jgi:hypothetical protein
MFRFKFLILTIATITQLALANDEVCKVNYDKANQAIIEHDYDQLALSASRLRTSNCRDFNHSFYDRIQTFVKIQSSIWLLKEQFVADREITQTITDLSNEVANADFTKEEQNLFEIQLEVLQIQYETKNSEDFKLKDSEAFINNLLGIFSKMQASFLTDAEKNILTDRLVHCCIIRALRSRDLNCSAVGSFLPRNTVDEESYSEFPILLASTIGFGILTAVAAYAHSGSHIRREFSILHEVPFEWLQHIYYQSFLSGVNFVKVYAALGMRYSRGLMQNVADVN